MSDSNNVDLNKGIGLEEVKVTQVEIAPGQAALVVYEDGATLVVPTSEDGTAMVTRSVLFTLGVYLESASPAFVEKMIRVAIDSLQAEGVAALKEAQGTLPA